GVDHPVCRLRPLAARVAAGRSAGAATKLLAATTGWGAGGAGVTAGPRTTGRAELPRDAPDDDGCGARDGGAESTEPAARGDAVYDAVGSMANAAGAVQRADRRCGRDAERGAQSRGNRSADRFL